MGADEQVDVGVQAGAPEWTFALIKPDAVRAGKAEEIKQLIEIHGFTIIAQEKVQLTRSRAEEFYAEHLGKPFFPGLLEFMTSGPVWALVLAKVGAIKAWRALMGPTNSLTAREQAPRSLRGLYGTDGTRNATHGSDSPASATREIKFFFPKLILEPLVDAASAKVYITQHLQPALAKALTALAREKPSAERFEAITFLAEFLLNNNPNKPRIVLPDDWDPSTEAMEGEDEEFIIAPHLRAVSGSASQPADKAAAPVVKAAAAPAPAQPPVIAKLAIPPSSSTAPAPVATPSPRPLSSPTADAEGTGSGADSDRHAAATKVQATFRGYQARKELADQQRSSPRAAEEGKGSATETGATTPASPKLAQEQPAEAAQGGAGEAGAAAAQAEVAPAGEAAEERPTASGFTPEQEQAAVRIQAAGRGMIDRKRVAEIKKTEVSGAEGDSEVPGSNAEAVAEVPEPAAEAAAPEADAPAAEALPDLAAFTPEQKEAAIKIQAAGRGMIDRKRVAAIKKGEIADAEGEGAEGAAEVHDGQPAVEPE